VLLLDALSILLPELNPRIKRLLISQLVFFFFSNSQGMGWLVVEFRVSFKILILILLNVK
jgi:hypothetical protein